jgi:hypothetical protein
MGTLTLYLLGNTFITVLSSLLCFFIPGLLVTQILKLRSTPICRFVLAVVIGIALFGAQAYVFGWFGVRFVSYGYIVAVAGVSFWQRQSIKQYIGELWHAVRTLDTIIIALVVGVVLLQSLQMFGNGLPQVDGMKFWRTNAYDGIYHLGLIESMKRTLPPVEPSSSGQPVINYHYWSDLVISEQSRVFKTPSVFLFFQWWPIFVSTLSALALVELVRLLTKSQTLRFTHLAIVLSLVLLALGSDSGWALYWLLHDQISFVYPAIDNGPTQFLNMPHTFGKLFLLSIGSLFLIWRKDRHWSVLFLLLFLSAVCIGIKVYFGLALALGFFGIFLYDAVVSRSVSSFLRLVGMGVVYLIMIAVIYLPVNSGAGGLSWYPLEWPTLLINRNNIDWTDLAIRIGIARYEHNTSKQALYNMILVAVGLIAIHGSRALGFLLTKRSVRMFGSDGIIFFFVPVLICTILGFTTLQVSGGFNVFNFFVVSLSILSISAALLLAEVYEKNRIIGALLITIVVLLCLPRSLYETVTMAKNYKSGDDSVFVTAADLQAFSYLRTLPDSAVVATSLDHDLERRSTYQAAFSGKQSYFSGKYLLETHNEPFVEKEQNNRYLFSHSTLYDIKNTANRLGITHIVVNAAHLNTPAERALYEYRKRAAFGNEPVFVYDMETL